VKTEEIPNKNRFIDAPTTQWLAAWNWLSERANPFVVKEARQSFNSRQFVLSFSILLIAVFTWTWMAVLTQLPQVYYLPGGQLMLSGLKVILAVPLLLIIPFSAFRSMLMETEEQTFELVSISSISAQQIVNGKMLSAVLQTGFFTLATAPCFVITYLLRGVSLSSILNYLFFTGAIALVLTAFGILLATIGRAKLLQSLANLVMLGVVLPVMGTWIPFSADESLGELDKIPFVVLVAVFTIVAAVLPLLLRSAAAAIDFPSQNHAMPVRIRISILMLVLLAWGIWTVFEARDIDIAFPWLVGSTLFFLAVGSLVASERGVISPRSQRTLPATMLGRMFLIWLYPGAGLGYVFLVCLFTGYISAWIGLSFYQLNDIRNFGSNRLIPLCILCWAYFVFYSGVTRLFMLAIPRSTPGRMLVGLLAQVIILAVGIFLPLLVAMLATGFRPFSYGPLHFLNMPWTITQLARSGAGMVGPSILALALAAIIVFGLNLLLCCRDVLLVRASLPDRLLEEKMKDSPQVTLAPPDPFA
jgi:hypothetical protein